ncbi:ATP-binding cassette domain-containing protein [Prochlorococcus sp. MIT 1300]|uniref:ABC transporter ATP-binding protein n=1 Tax=Prochlorococcus sp. MIT 1300 TaxID=3096218 RepID=UPI002A757B29|nr:ATP-binding cassette domain-containing protein [Prochlorococcus sp. MIT 1300]
MSIIQVENLSKSYLISEKKPGIIGTVSHFINRQERLIEAVSRVSFRIDKGEMVGFIGPNGAGKTTTLKMLCGLIFPSSGVVRVGGYRPFLRERSFLQDITLVMGQKQQLIWDLPPLDSLKVNAAVYGLSDLEANHRIKELSEMLELGYELKVPVRKLSLGQRMKAELLASLLHRPSVLFLDEPTLGLDINAQVRVRDFLASYNREFGATMIVTSHYMGDITSLCKRVLLIHQGTLLNDCSLEELEKELLPSRSLRVELSRPYPKDGFQKFGIVEDYSESFVQLLVPRDELTRTLTKLLNTFSVKDFEVRDPTIEKLIGQLFTKGGA